MTPALIGGTEIPDSESVMARRLASILGVDSEGWDIKFGAVIKGRSGVLHTFDAILESNRDHKVATVMFLKETDDEKSQKLMLHNVKSNDIPAYASYLVVDHDLNSRENTIREMCHLKDFKVNPSDLDAYRYTSVVRVSENGDYTNPGRMEGQTPVSGHKMPLRRNRDRTKIVHEILGSVIYLKSASITQLIYRCNLNYKYAKTLLGNMTGKGLIDIVDYDGVGKRYEITAKGLKTFERLEFHEYV